MQRLTGIKKQFSDLKGAPPIREMSVSWPDYAGSVLWANGLRQSVDQLVALVENSNFVDVNAMPVMRDARQFTSNLKDYATRMFKNWYTLAANFSDKLLAVPLMMRGSKDDGDRLKLVLNFDPALFELFQEVHFFKKVRE